MIATLLHRRVVWRLLVVVALSSPYVARAADDEAARAARPWFVPDHAKLQLAGEIGWLSAGAGYRLAGEKLHLDFLFGWVPQAIGGDSIYDLTAKLTYGPWRLRAGDRWRITPFHAAVQLTYTFGWQYFTRPPERYPNGYYDLPTALYTGVAVGGAVSRLTRGNREVGAYWEFVALPSQLRDWWHNREVLGMSDAISFAAGVMVAF